MDLNEVYIVKYDTMYDSMSVKYDIYQVIQPGHWAITGQTQKAGKLL